ncbi:MAG: DUF4363 family protein [Clostridia bacterium]|nr:DUF4363 family protein [Clostridia bacterium]
MRWRVLIAAILIVALLVGGGVCRRKVGVCCGEVAELVKLARAELRPEPLEEAARIWERRLPLLSCVLTHDRLERVGEGLARAEGFLRAGDRGNFLAQIDGLLYFLDDIREYDHIRLQALL